MEEEVYEKKRVTNVKSGPVTKKCLALNGTAHSGHLIIRLHVDLTLPAVPKLPGLW